MMKYKTLWHVTPAYNIDSILGKGIDPEYAHSERKLVWGVEWKGLPYALAHVSARHGMPVNKLYAIRFRVKVTDVRHHRLWIWYTPVRQKRGLLALRGDKALAQWELQRATMRAYTGRRVRSANGS